VDKTIFYPNDNGGLVMVIPADCGIPVEEIARKDVPAGKPYIIANNADLPADRAYIDAWVADFSEPDGYGIGPDAWFAERAAQENQ
jgi:hypothetical protein